MATQQRWRRRERSSAGVPSVVRAGTIRKKRDSDNVTVETIPFNNATWPYTSNEVTWDQKNQGPPFKSGGPFASVKANVDLGVKGSGFRKGPPNSAGGGFHWEFDGGFARPLLAYELPTLDSYSNLSKADPYTGGVLTSESALGSEAYDRLRPKLSHADLSVFLYELKDTSRMLSTSAHFFKDVFRQYSVVTEMKNLSVSDKWLQNYWADLRRLTPNNQTARKAADNYLNHTFGWVPFVNDLLKINEAYQNQRKYVDQITKDNGSWIRRVRTISDDHTETVDSHSGFSQGIAWRPEFDSMTSDMSVGTYSRYRLDRRTIKHSRIWAAGSFTYYRPEFDRTLSDYESNWNDAMRLLTIYGARINPYILWKITPWTWLVDWFIGIGTLIDRAVSWGQDGVVSRYMYLMKHSITSVQHLVTVNWNNGPSTFSWTNSLDSKQREIADNNFSFRLSGALTARQLAIIAALGLSRSH